MIDVGKISRAAERDEKIALLFRDRRIADHLEFALENGRERDRLYSKLRSLQEPIYLLDSYGESTWCIDARRLAAIWTEIIGRVRAFGFSGGESASMVNDILRYQSVELSMRAGQLPGTVPIKEFYWLKTCDVRLARTLIGMAAKHKCSFSSWSCFDAVSEVCDDLLDLEEDAGTYNGNRVLWSGMGAAFRKEYLEFLEAIERRVSDIEERDSRSSSSVDVVCQWTHQRIAHAKCMIASLPEFRQPEWTGGPTFCYPANESAPSFRSLIHGWEGKAPGFQLSTKETPPGPGLR
jgi:hypothetical protein